MKQNVRHICAEMFLQEESHPMSPTNLKTLFCDAWTTKLNIINCKVGKLAVICSGILDQNLK